MEFSGEDRSRLLAQLDSLVELMADIGLPGTVVPMPDAAAQKALWDVRKAGLNIMMSLKGDGKPVSFIEDCAVPLEHLAEYTARLTEVFARHGTRGTWYAHASVGTLHVRPILDMRSAGAAGGASKMRAIAEEAAVLVRRYKGAFSGEHGDGLVRSEWVSWQFGERLTRSFEEIKDLFDPDNLMNPGKIVRPARMDDASLFRYKPGYSVAPLSTGLDWSGWNVQTDPVTERTSAPGTGGDPAGGLSKAVEMCNNNGHCRKFDAGTMCPSFRVTRNERDLTRGRANTLRLALSGQLGGDGLNSPAVQEALSLCVSCKGCRRDCPTGVDMARMKIEVLHQRSKASGIGLRQKLVAFLPRYAAFAGRHAWLFNARDRLPGAAYLTERFLGLSARRSLPRWRRDTFLARAGAVQAVHAANAANAARRMPPTPSTCRRGPAKWCCGSTPSATHSSPRSSSPPGRSFRPPVTRCTSPRRGPPTPSRSARCAVVEPICRPAWSSRPGRKRCAACARSSPSSIVAPPSSGSSPRAC